LIINFVAQQKQKVSFGLCLRKRREKAQKGFKEKQKEISCF